jgi:hypothetical protein
MAGIRHEGNSGVVDEVDADRNAYVRLPGYSAAGVALGGGPDAGPAMFSEIDPGIATANRVVASPETDDDFRLRIAHETLLDRETFNYAAQNTGKHSYANTTMTNVWTVNGLQTNSASITTINTGTSFQSRAWFPLPVAGILYADFVLAPSVAPIPSNTTVDVGLFIPAAANPYAPGDGVYFRFTASGVFGAINSSSVETVTGALALPGGLVTGARVRYLIAVTERTVQFWAETGGQIYLLGTLACPATRGALFAAAALPFAIRHAIGGTAAGAGFSAFLTDYGVSIGGPLINDSLGGIGNRSLGSYQGLSGGTMGTLANYANSANPTTAAGSNTAANVTGLGGQGAINAAAAAATDFIMCSYQVPAGTTAVQGRRLRINGVKVWLVNQGAAVATTPTTLALSLAFGHTAVSLATAEAATTKAPRRIPLGIVYWPVAAAIGVPSTPDSVEMRLDNPVYVNPGEFVAVAMKFLVGTATASQSIWYHATFDYGWE